MYNNIRYFNSNILWCYVIYRKTNSQMAGWLTVGLLFLRSKDSLIALPKK